jgi:DNA-binding transcriptional LysR family regulator
VLDIPDLRTFLAVARTKGITAAGRELNTVQSNVTTRIKNLEEEIGVPLFARHSRGMILTEAGQRLLPHAERILALSREAKTAARDDGVPRGQLRIGSMETTAAVRLPTVLAAYHRACPHVKLHLKTAPTAQLIDSVLACELDVAFVAGPVDHPALQTFIAFDEELVLITPRAFGSMNDMIQSSAEGLSALMFRQGCAYRQRLEQVLADLGLRSYERLELGTLDGILGCVAAGVGITLLPRTVVEQSIHANELRCHSLPPSVSRVSTLLVARKDVRIGAAFDRFTDTLRGLHSIVDARPTAPPLSTGDPLVAETA